MRGAKNLSEGLGFGRLDVVRRCRCGLLMNGLFHADGVRHPFKLLQDLDPVDRYECDSLGGNANHDDPRGTGVRVRYFCTC
jgi:hypothetical protein